MKREFLKSFELSDEAIDKIMAEYGNSVNSLRSKQTDLEGQIDTYKQRVSERDQQLEGLKKAAGDSEKLQAQIEKLQAENKKSSEAYEAKLMQMRIDNSVNLSLTNAKAKNIKAVRALLDLENAKLDGETVVGLSEQITKLQESDPYLFDGISKPKISGTKPTEGLNNPVGSNPAPNSYEYFLAQETGQN